MKEIRKIVITGGPCAGKTTAMSWIQNYFTKMGYRVLFVPETATELISGGVAPWTCGTNLEFQLCQMKLQMEKEKIFVQAAESMDAERILVVCDRGMLDNKAYMNDVEFEEVLQRLSLREDAMLSAYDGVFHLVTAAKGAEEFYTLSNNQARTETVEQAAALDEVLAAAWSAHPHHRVIGNETEFDLKMQRLIQEIASFLGAPEPCQLERKFLIRRPDLAALEVMPNCEKVEIIQTYLKSREGRELRVRQRGSNGSYIYFRTEKILVAPGKRLELEKRLSQSEYLEWLGDADPAMRPIGKDRYCLTMDDQYFEIDVFPFWEDQAILEIALTSETEAVKIPDFIEVIREVTGLLEYSNFYLAGGRE